jgi:hypothetical protein
MFHQSIQHYLGDLLPLKSSYVFAVASVDIISTHASEKFLLSFARPISVEQIDPVCNVDHANLLQKKKKKNSKAFRISKLINFVLVGFVLQFQLSRSMIYFPLQIIILISLHIFAITSLLLIIHDHLVNLQSTSIWHLIKCI